MATGGLYGNASESVGLYGNTTNFGGSYFEWFIFYQSDTQPATPTGGSWSFVTNSGTAPTGWSTVPFPAPTLPVWVSIALVNSRSDVPLVWSAPGLFSYSSGLPILSGSGTPAVGDGINSQLYVQTSTTPQTIWFKQSGTWNRLVGSTLYADLTSAQTVAGIKTFSSPIVGSVTGTSANVTGIVDIANGGTSSTTANGAFNALAPSQTSQAGKYLTTDGTNASWGTNPLGTVTSVDVSGGTTGLTTSGGPVTTSGTITLAGTLAVANGGTGATTTGVALTNLGAVGTIASADASIVVTRVGSSVDLSVSQTSPASVLLEQVRNTTGATLTKGTAVYISGATGQIPTVSKALATSDATSAQTLGLITSNLANNSNGFVTIIGLISDLDTSAYTDGQQLYLSPITAGTLTATKPYAPQHLVYMAVVSHAHPTQGKLLVKVQNGYELDEIHNVAAQSPTTGQTIVWNSATSLWEKNTVSLTVGVNGTLPILNGGTGQATANAAFNALAPSQTGNSGKYLTTNGTDTSWATNPLGTVTSVGGTGTVSGITLSGTVTTSGNLTLGGTLDLSAYNGAGAFTTLSASSTVTLSGGTTNGVTYLNGSKVVTSGSALTFDGTNLNLGVNGATLYWTATGNNVAINTSSGVMGFYTGTSAYGLAQQINADGTTFWKVGGSEQMRLTSTGLGIGTSSPAVKLDVTGTSRSTVGIMIGSATDNSTGGFSRSGGDTYLDYAGVLHVRSGAASERMTLTAAGDLGIGTSSPLFKLQSNGTVARKYVTAGTSGSPAEEAGFIYADDTSTPVAGMWFYNAFSSNSATQLSFKTRTSGGTVTEAVRIDASQNIGLGVTPSAWVSTYKAFELFSSGCGVSSDAATKIQLAANFYRVSGADKYGTTGEATLYSQASGVHKWFNAPSGTAGTNISFTQAMTLDASGNLGLGATSITAFGAGYTTAQIQGTSGGGVKLYGGSTNYGFMYADTNGFYIGNPTSTLPIVFQTNSAERARIDSSGTLLVGCTGGGASGNAIVTYGSGSDIQKIFSTQASSSIYTLISMFSGATTPSSPTGTLRVNITTNGGIANYQANDSNLSDRREKTNFAPATSYLDKICAIPVQTFNYIDQNLEEDAGLTLGVVAQDVQAVAPELVMESNWASKNEEPKMRLSIYQTDLQYALMKALQELKAEFDAYKASHP